MTVKFSIFPFVAAFFVFMWAAPAARADVFAAPPQPDAKITASDHQANDELGNAVDLDLDTLVVGAHDNNDDGTHSGSAYVFERNQGGAENWGQTRKLLASDADTGDEFGYDVAVKEDLIIVGAPYAQGDDGAAYIFERDQGGPGNWGQIFKLVATDGSSDEEFGLSVDIDGDLCVVGAHFNDLEASHAGAAYLFRRTGGGTSEWVQIRQFTASNAAINDEFGFDVAIDDEIVVIGSPMYNDKTSNTGSAYIFEADHGGPNNWGEVKRIVSDNIGSNDEFGTAVAIHGDLVAVGAPNEDTAAPNGGAAYVFERNQGGVKQWGQVAQLNADDAEFNDKMGNQIAIHDSALHGGLVIVGAMEEDRTLLSGAGAAYLFFRDQGGPDTWAQAEKLVAFDEDGSDNFGSAVAVGPVTAMAGAMNSNGGATGSGSVYPFQLTFNIPPTVDDQAFSLPENSPNGTEVGVVVANSEDPGQSLSFAILSGNVGQAFTLGEADGQITVANSNVLDLETIPEFVLEVEVTDDGEPNLSTRAEMTVTLSDIPEDADVSVRKTAIGTRFAGDPLTYRVTVENHGPLVATNVVVRDDLPAEVNPSQTITTPVGDLEPGEDFTFTIEVVVDSSLTSPLTNRVTAIADTPDSDTENNGFTLVTPISPMADLSVVKTAPDFVWPGNAIFYSIVVSNAGPSVAANLSVVDTLPPGLTSSGSITNLLASLAPGAVHFFAIPTQSDGQYLGELTNVVTVSSDVPDADLSDNTSTVTTLVNYIADVGIGKEGPAVVTDSRLVQYVLSITNHGPSVAQDIVITDTLPPGMVFDPSGSDLLCSQDGSNVVCSLPSLDPSFVAMLLVRGTLDPTVTGSVLNVAQVTTSAIDPNPSNDLASALTFLPDFDGDGQADFSDPDNENDGMPDDWEIQHGLDPYLDDGSLDLDADEFLNLDEYIADTIPTNALSYLSVTGIEPAMVVKFDSSSNRYYSLEFVIDFSSGSWLPVAGQTHVPGVGGPQSITNAVSDPEGHYRIRAHIP